VLDAGDHIDALATRIYVACGFESGYPKGLKQGGRGDGMMKLSHCGVIAQFVPIVSALSPGRFLPGAPGFAAACECRLALDLHIAGI
jgi:hypothetical protein